MCLATAVVLPVPVQLCITIASLASKANVRNTHNKTHIAESLDAKADKTGVAAGLNLKMAISDAYD